MKRMVQIQSFYWIVKEADGTFPELKEIAMREYTYWETDMVLIEAKAVWYATDSRTQKDGYSCCKLLTK